MTRSFKFILILLLFFCSAWGFFAHRKINQLAIFTLPPEMIAFYKANINDITEKAVNPDKRRYAVPEEAARHYIDIDHYGDSAYLTMPHYWKDAITVYPEDTLKKYGILPWHINTMYYRLRDAFMTKDPDRVVTLSAELGHYLADAHVPLHTTENHNGQLTGQEGIHAFWESRLPELFSANYDFLVGRGVYISNPQEEAWKAIVGAHRAVDSVLREERQLAIQFGEGKYSFEEKNKTTVKVYSVKYSEAYHHLLAGMVERQMRASVKCVGNFWYSAWVDAGQPDLKALLSNKPTPATLARQRQDVLVWKDSMRVVREHE